MSLRWGMIGTGDVTERKSGPALYQADRSELAAVMNRTHSRAVDYAKRHGNPRVYATVDEILGDDSIDAVYIATAPDSHAELTARAASAGKHVFCEKPMAMSVAQCEGMIAVCEKNSVSLSIAFYNPCRDISEFKHGNKHRLEAKSQINTRFQDKPRYNKC